MIVAVFLALPSACGSPPPMDVERSAIWSSLNAVLDAASAAARTPPGDELRAAARQTFETEGARLRRLRDHPDGRRYVEDAFERMRSSLEARQAAAAGDEAALLERSDGLDDPGRTRLSAAARERYDAELRLEALGRLRSAVGAGGGQTLPSSQR